MMTMKTFTEKEDELGFGDKMAGSLVRDSAGKSRRPGSFDEDTLLLEGPSWTGLPLILPTLAAP